jgi:hypothetical protein
MGLKLFKAFPNVFQSTFNLPAFALNKQVDAVMLGFQDFEKCISERLLGCVALAWDR